MFIFSIFRSGSVRTLTKIKHEIVVADEEIMGTVCGLIPLTRDQYLEFFLENNTSDANATITKMTMTAVKVS